MKILVLDNYDSFTYNLVHSLREAGAGNITVARNDKIAVEDAAAYDKILLSPGPGIPSESGILCALINEYAPSKSIFGVCLGEQAIGEVFGARLLNLPDVYHGVGTEIKVTAPDPVFAGVDETFVAGRYHSWIVDREGFPDGELEITAEDATGNIMALRHRRYDVRGVQFHPESVLTPCGNAILKNWLEL
ncbi:MAG: aminodeoxychorismate/anthranilate synthase component II [Rikenellaceae bacterium]|nr:aminodeoxychorismate/anthranilate synthase component II [Rikenellaceae bacterium]